MRRNGDEDTTVPHKLKLLEIISDLSYMIERPFALQAILLGRVRIPYSTSLERKNLRISSLIVITLRDILSTSVPLDVNQSK
jgi:hypothetical protein